MNHLAIPIELFADRPLSLISSPDDFPNQSWSAQTQAYDQWWAYYRGYVLNQKKNNIELYPVKLNIVRSATINHAAVLLGQFKDDQILQFGIRDNPAIKSETKQKTVRAMNLFWAVNNGDDLLLEQSLFQQIFGGYFYKVAWMPIRNKYPFRIFTVDPRACFPVWDGDDYNRLVSIDVYHQVPRPTAVVRYRVDLVGNRSIVAETGIPDFVTVHEHWDETEYFIKIDEQIGQWPDGSPMQGRNPYSDPVLGIPIIPYVYAPRMRVGEFFGESLVPGLIGPQNEINNNLAHLGEGLADSMHQQPWIRNRPKGTQGLENRSRSEWLNLGMGQPGQKEPEAGRLDGAEISDSAKSLVTEDLPRMAREHVNMPDVAYGRTDASIRSALTLKFMMWPATNVGLRYRKHSSTAIKQLMYYALAMAHSKRQIVSSLNGVSSIGFDSVTPEMLEAILIGSKVIWPPMLPDDRVEIVNEVVQRASVNMISPERGITMLDGPDELEEELNRIDESRKKVAEQEAKLMQQRFQQPGGSPAGDRTNRAQAKGGRAKNEE